MASKTPLIATGVLVIGAAATLLLNRETSTKDERIGERLFPASTAPTIDALEIRRGEGDPLRLVRDERSVWHVGDVAGFPVDAGKVLRFLDDLGTNTYRDVALRGALGIAEFGLDAPVSIALKAKDATVYAASFGNDRKGGGQYVTPDGGATIYLVSQSIRAPVDVDQWELKTLLDVKKDEVKSVVFTPVPGGRKSGVTLARDKADELLKLVGPASVKASPAVARVDAGFANIGFTKRYDPSNEEAKAALDKAARIQLTLFDGRIYEMAFGSVGSQTPKHFLKIVGSAPDGSARKDEVDALNQLMATYAFEVSAAVIANLDKSLADFVVGDAPKG